MSRRRQRAKQDPDPSYLAKSDERAPWTRVRERQAIDSLQQREQDAERHKHIMGTPRVEGIHPDLLKIANVLTAAMGTAGFPMQVTDGLRTLEEQQALYAQGRTIPGRIVTFADGTHTKSNHQVREDGLGHALDLTFINPETSKPFWPVDSRWIKAWRAYGRLAVALGLEWGGDWKRPDMPHIQLASGEPHG